MINRSSSLKKYNIQGNFENNVKTVLFQRVSKRSLSNLSQFKNDHLEKTKFFIRDDKHCATARKGVSPRRKNEHRKEHSWVVFELRESYKQQNLTGRGEI